MFLILDLFSLLNFPAHGSRSPALRAGAVCAVPCGYASHAFWGADRWYESHFRNWNRPRSEETPKNVLRTSPLHVLLGVSKLHKTPEHGHGEGFRPRRWQAAVLHL